MLIRAVRRSLLRRLTYGIEGADRKSSTNNVKRTSRYYRVRGWHCCHRPPLRTVLATFAAHGSSISNALFGGRGTTTEAFCGISLPVQLHMTNRMHHNQIGH